MHTENIKQQVKTQINEPEDMCEEVMWNAALSGKWAGNQKDIERDEIFRE